MCTCDDVDDTEIIGSPNELDPFECPWSEFTGVVARVDVDSDEENIECVSAVSVVSDQVSS
jgi:hypothetical protein